MGTVKVQGGELFYEVAGEGRPVVLLHPGFLDRTIWDDEFELLARTRRVIRYDARGHGRSSAPAGDYAHHEDLRDLLAGLGISRATLVGLSLGARTAIDLALTNPGMVEALVLVSPGMSGMTFEDPAIVERHARLEEAAVARDGPGVVEWFLRAWVDGPKRATDEVPPAIRERLRSIAMANLPKQAAARGRNLELEATKRVGELRGPVLAIVGELDAADIHRVVGQILAGVPEARSIGIPSAGHMVNLERPRVFQRALLSFLGASGASTD